MVSLRIVLLNLLRMQRTAKCIVEAPRAESCLISDYCKAVGDIIPSILEEA